MSPRAGRTVDGGTTEDTAGTAAADQPHVVTDRTRHPARLGRPGRGGQDAGHRSPDRDRRGAPGAGDPLSVDSVITEVTPSRSHLHFEIVPGLSASDAVPTYAGLPLGSSHPLPTSRRGLGGFGRGPGPLILQATPRIADAARTLIDYGLADATPCVVTSHGHLRQQRFGRVDAGQVLRPDATLSVSNTACAVPSPLIAHYRQDGGQPGSTWVGAPRPVRWTVLVPRTKDQAGDMSERLTSHRALPIEVPTIAVEPPRSPAQMERAVKGPVDGPRRSGWCSPPPAVRAVWEKFGEFGLDARAFSGVKSPRRRIDR